MAKQQPRPTRNLEVEIHARQKGLRGPLPHDWDRHPPCVIGMTIRARRYANENMLPLGTLREHGWRIVAIPALDRDRQSGRPELDWQNPEWAAIPLKPRLPPTRRGFTSRGAAQAWATLQVQSRDGARRDRSSAAPGRGSEA